MTLLKFVLRLGMLAAVVAAFFAVPFCWVSLKVQGLLWGVLATFLLGRFFCDTLCPLGILQSFVNWLFHPRTHVRRVCSRLPETKAQRIVRWCVFAAAVALGAFGCMGLVTCILPISVFGKAVATVRAVVDAGSVGQAFDTPEALFFAAFSLAVFLAVMALAAFGRGRLWCNWICPFGTVYNLVAKIALRKSKVGKGCGNCKRCFTDGEAISRSPQQEKDTSDSPKATRRETLKGVAMLAATGKLTDGGYAGVSLPGVPDRKPVLPPGAGMRSAFALKCAACQLCVANCPGGCLKPSVRLGSFGQPELDFRHGSCIATCVKCGEICPEGAIAHLQPERRRHVHVGRAVWKKDLCIRTTEKVPCTACERKCPVQAIHVVKGFPVVDPDTCIGCGACEHVCPSRPMPAIFVEGYDEQRIVNPVSGADLRAEAASPVGDLYAFVRDGEC